MPSASTASDGAFEPVGGAIADGTYATKGVRFFYPFSSVFGETIEFGNGFYHRNSTIYSAKTGDAMTGFEEVGSFTTAGGDLTFEGTACTPGNPSHREVWEYSVTDLGFKILRRSGALRWEETYEVVRR